MFCLSPDSASSDSHHCWSLRSHNYPSWLLAVCGCSPELRPQRSGQTGVMWAMPHAYKSYRSISNVVLCSRYRVYSFSQRRLLVLSLVETSSWLLLFVQLRRFVRHHSTKTSSWYWSDAHGFHVPMSGREWSGSVISSVRSGRSVLTLSAECTAQLPSPAGPVSALCLCFPAIFWVRLSEQRLSDGTVHVITKVVRMAEMKGQTEAGWACDARLCHV